MRIVGHRHAALARGDRLVGIERKAGDGRTCSHRSCRHGSPDLCGRPPGRRERRLRRPTVHAAGKSTHRVHVHHQSTHVYRHNSYDAERGIQRRAPGGKMIHLPPASARSMLSVTGSQSTNSGTAPGSEPPRQSPRRSSSARARPGRAPAPAPRPPNEGGGTRVDSHGMSRTHALGKIGLELLGKRSGRQPT